MTYDNINTCILCVDSLLQGLTGKVITLESLKPVDIREAENEADTDNIGSVYYRYC